MTTFPALVRSSDSRRNDRPEYDRRFDLGVREDNVARRDRELAHAEAELREREAACESRERALERRELERELLGGEQAAGRALPFSLRDLPADPQARTKFLADLVIIAGKRRRGEMPSDPPLPAHPVARAIVLAGMKRRGEMVEREEPKSDVERRADAIIAAGKRRRGEIA